MSFDGAIRNVADAERGLRSAATSADSAWRDSVREQFERQTVQPLTQSTTALGRDLANCAQRIEGALRRLRQ